MVVVPYLKFMYISNSKMDSNGFMDNMISHLHQWKQQNQRVLPQLNFQEYKMVEVEGDYRVQNYELTRLIKYYEQQINYWRSLRVFGCSVPWLQVVNLDMVFKTPRVPVHPKIQLAQVNFGTFHDANRYSCRFTTNFLEQEAQFEHDCSPGTLKVNFTSPARFSNSNNSYRVRRLELLYNNIVRVIVCKENLYFFLKCSPKVFTYKSCKKRPVHTLSQVDDQNQIAWIRTRRVPGLDVSIIGKCNVMKIAVKDRNALLEILTRIQHSGEIPVFWSPVMEQVATAIDQTPALRTEYFDCLYAWKCFTSRGFQVTDFLTDDFMKLIELYMKMPSGTVKVEKTLYFLTSLLDNYLWFSFTPAFRYFFKHLTDNPHLLKEPSFRNYRHIRRVMVTPSRTLWLKPELVHDNRIVRQYCSDYALRLCFRDEDMSSRLSPGFTQFSEKFLDMVIGEPLRDGLTLLGRHYEFLGWSNSQMKDHCLWMYARDPDGLRAQDIRKDAGDFSGVRSVPKYCARFGQCLTQTEEALKVGLGAKNAKNRVVVSYERDITDPRKKYIFSDGIGRTSWALAMEICGNLKKRKNQKKLLPSAYQIRFGGCKGMLAIDPRLSGMQVIFRESQKKFEANQVDTNCALEIAKYSQPSRTMLNRPMISILEHLRRDIPNGQDVFHELQEVQLMAMSEMLLYEEQAEKQLKQKSSLSLNFTALRESGVPFTTEPFFRQMLLAINRKMNSHLAKKARIEIPPEYGRNLLGALDETGKLKYGQVFIQYSEHIEKPRKTTLIHRGKLIVTKNPCLHPGDVRVFDAVDIPQLHHMVDVIVFPQKGHRPHPDEMAGSDLDGDEYQAIWLPKLIFPNNERPMDFPKPRVKEHVGPITVEDMIQCFKNFVEKDQLGLISSAHMAHGDTQGLNSNVCCSLASKASLAVDFQKSGYIKEISECERVQSYPDFMGKSHKTHRSEKILGQLYRKASRVEQLSAASIQHKPEVLADPHLVHPSWMEYYGEACKDRDAYFQEIQDLMAQYGIGNESELISGNVLHMHMVMMERSELYDIEAILTLRINDLQERYKEQFHKEFGGLIPEGFNDMFIQLDEKMLAKASAYYVVTYDQRIGSPNKTGLLSFPWVVASDLLVEMKNQRCQGKEDAPLASHLDQEMSQSYLPYLPVQLKPEHQNEKYVLFLKVLVNWVKYSNLTLDPDVVVKLAVKSCTDLALQEGHSVGVMILKVIQHWASQMFKNSGACVKLHGAAFHTFHRIAISGQFLALHLHSDGDSEHFLKNDFDMGEFKRFSVHLSEDQHESCFQLFQSYGNEDTVRGIIKEKLERFSGMDLVELRVKKSPREVTWFFSGYGSFEARETLRDILICKKFVQLLRESAVSGFDCDYYSANDC